jgi:CO dehydrogenase maturation factor
MFLAFVNKVEYGNLVSGRPNLIITGQNGDKAEQNKFCSTGDNYETGNYRQRRSRQNHIDGAPGASLRGRGPTGTRGGCGPESVPGALGFPDELRAQLHPIAEMDALIEERTGAKPGTVGGFFTLNPRVDDIPERFSVLHRGVKLLEMGSVELGGSGCICPEAAMLKTLFTHLLFRKDDVLLLDMYAGVEHLGRATVDFVDAMLVVVEPTRRSLGTAAQIKKLANDIKLDRLYLVGNKVRNEDEAKFLEAESPDMPVLGFLPADMKVQEADRLGIPVYDHVPSLKEAAAKIVEKLASEN